MNPAERVRVALARRQPDRVPLGEFAVSPRLAAKIAGRPYPPTLSERMAVHRALGLDLAAVPALDGRELTEWRRDTDLFIFGIVDGPFQGAARVFGFADYLAAVRERPDLVAARATEAIDRSIELGRRCIDWGAHGLVIADDVAWDRATFIAPVDWQSLFLPLLATEVRTLRGLQCPLVYHSDGDIRAILPELAALGFDGLHSLQPSAGMNLGSVKTEYGDRLCLMGNYDLALLASDTPVSIIRSTVVSIMNQAAKGGGFIFGSCAGVLGDNLPPDKILAVYEAAVEYGRY